MQNIQPTKDHVLLRAITPSADRTIIIPENATPVDRPYGLVLAIGPDVTSCAVNDKVLFFPNGAIGLEEGPEPLLMISEGVIFAVLSEPPTSPS